jgi:hypothetical protein
MRVVRTFFNIVLIIAVFLGVVAWYFRNKWNKVKQIFQDVLQQACVSNFEEGMKWGYPYTSLPPSSTVFDKRTADYLVTACAVSSGLLCVPTKFVPPNGTLQEYVNLESTYAGESVGYIAFTGSTALISWRATQTLFDVTTDLTVDQLPGSQIGLSGNVHKGFLMYYMSVRDAVLNAVSSSKLTTIWVTGHSLGAAVAQLCMLDIANTSEAKVIGYTFAAPKTGDFAFIQHGQQLSNLTCYRIQNSPDIVPTMPIGSPTSEYYNLGDLVLITEETGVSANNHGLSAYKQGIKNLPH